MDEPEYKFWKVNYLSMEGNTRWQLVRCPGEWELYDVEVKAQSLCYGCGDDMCKILSIEEDVYDRIYNDWS